MMVLSYISSIVVLPKEEQGGTMFVNTEDEDISEPRVSSVETQ